MFKDLRALYMLSPLTRLLADPRFRNDVRCKVYCRQSYSAAVQGGDLHVREYLHRRELAGHLTDTKCLLSDERHKQ